MKLGLALLLCALPLMAQEAAPEAAAESPRPSQEQYIQGSVDVGYRWVSDISGSRDTYRSVVNLAEGFRVMGADLSIVDPDRRLFDKLTLFADRWGDPNNTGRIELERSRTYRFSFDYRNIAYYNFLPSFASPGTADGLVFNERSFDIRRKLYSAELEFLPGSWIRPYVAFSRDSGSGRGITPFVDGSVNEYPIGTDLRDSTNNYRIGLRQERRRWHVTIEGGRTAFKDDQRVFADSINYGNRTSTLLGRTLFLDGADQSYVIRGKSRYGLALFTASPASWANLQGQFLYSQPETDVQYNASAEGLFYLGATRFYSSQQTLSSGEAKQPHTSGSFTAEIRPHQRVRVFESILADRLHNGSSLLAAEQRLLVPGNTETTQVFAGDRLVKNYNRQQVDAFVDVTRSLTLRGGHRYEWGEAVIRAASLNPSGNPESGELRRHVLLAGGNYRLNSSTRVNVDYEHADTSRSYFRLSLHDYDQLRIRGRIQARSSVEFGMHFRVLDNENPTQGIEYDSRALSAGASVHWRPMDGKWVTLLGDYTWSSYESNIQFRLPPFLTLTDSAYRDRAHVGTGMIEFRPPAQGAVAPTISIGGSVLRSGGSRPTTYYQPMGRILVPLNPHIAGYAEWRWYGMSQLFYSVEGFQTHHILAGLRWTL